MRTTQWNALPADGVSTVLGWFGNVRRISPLARARVTFPRASVGAGLRLAAPSNTSRYSAADTFFVYREREYIGRVERGMWQGRNDPTILNDLRAVLANPLQATITAGRATGTCCFCARALTDDRSVSVGYGPICAGHYGLPWGDTSNDVIRATNIHGQSMEPLGRLADERRARATPPAPRAPAAPGRPDLPSFSDGGPDDEDRQFM